MTWLDENQYPFPPRWFELPEGRLHYVDEGQGRPIVMVHGTPTWSFLYRHLIRGLRAGYRCVAADNLGFGLSDKPPAVSYRPGDQARRLTILIETLGLKDLTLVVHDFGGPIGLAYAIEHPDQVQSLVLFNTWMWSLEGDARYKWFGRLFGGRLGRLLYERVGFPTRVMLRHAIKDKARYTPAVHRQYVEALPDATARHATWVYAREVIGSSDWYDALWRRRERLAGLPALLVWGMDDPAFGGVLPRWQALFPRAEVIEFAGVGHAPPEERGPESATAIARFLGG